ncbi:hypothetical protein ABIB94_007094 [Bradyrhizobium sp. JR7.2]|uniref:tail fiber domain-containing protein n=1 Tax=Bradyrhizobium sp. JR7.2 TaxID=3156375 RepID=UPI003393C33E
MSNKLKLKVRTKIPAALLSGIGTVVTKNGLTYKVDLDYSQIIETNTFDPNFVEVAVWNPHTNEWARVSLTDFVNGSLSSATFDAISPTTTRGDIIFRGATANTRLAAGTAGQVLQTNGSGADPTWAQITANPSASIGLTANNGSATTAMRSDGTPALSQAIVPTWTGQHTFTSTAGGIKVAGSPNVSVPTSVHPYFGLTSQTSQLIDVTAATTNSPEAGLQCVMKSSTGFPNGGAYKMAGFFSATSNGNSSDIYGVNVVLHLETGSAAANAIGFESDINVKNADYGDTTGAPSGVIATPIYVAFGGNRRSTAAIAVNFGSYDTTNGPYAVNRGLVFYGGAVRLNVIEDYSSVGAGGFAFLNGVYADSLINARTSTGAYTVSFKLKNNKGISWMNAAASADILGINVNASDQVVLGDTSARAVTSTINPNGSSAAFTFINNHTTAGDIGVAIGAGSNSGSADSTTQLIQFMTPGSGAVGSVSRTTGSGVQYNTSSDARLKTDIAPAIGCLDRLMKIEAVDFTWVDDEQRNRVNGFIAQQLHEVYPAAVRVGGDNPESNPWSVDYGRLTPLLVGAIQELIGRVDNLHDELKALKSMPWHGSQSQPLEG